MNSESSIKPNDSLEGRRRTFTYSEIKRMTNDFEKVLGKGGFGTVYYGFIDEIRFPVAVKMLSASSAQGYQEFQAEARYIYIEILHTYIIRTLISSDNKINMLLLQIKLLMRVHHGNLTSLVGYCNEGTNMALVYEYMANGDLDSHLSSLYYVPVQLKEFQ